MPPTDRDNKKDEAQQDKDEAPRWSRRKWLGTGVALPLATVATAGSLTGEMPWQQGQAAIPPGFNADSNASSSPNSYVYLTPAEVAFLEAAVGRLIPKDDLGAGAIEAGVPYFIDRQLAGDFGAGSRWYMQGPWSKGESTQGFQARMPPAAYYRAAIREIDEAVQHEAGNIFAKLTPAAMDQWLHRLEDGKLTLPTTDAKTFFNMLWQNTLEGFWSDPIYGGNRDMAGWKLIGFPGARYDNTAYVSKHGEAYPLPPVGLKGRVEWIAKG
ncbi:MAG TPA: gluconate 2-dehydrogenase subunit 3 family protein [Burkholderiaceae bacterium]|jgi:gluconate 2-dehydrogenase gamma chain